MTTTLDKFVPTVIAAVEEGRGIPKGAIMRRCRRVPVALGRQISMWLVKRARGETWSKIGICFKRDHGTVIHAIRAVENLLEVDRKERAAVASLVWSLGETGIVNLDGQLKELSEEA